jgi:polar amino acid transport system substrate-binding protein
MGVRESDGELKGKMDAAIASMKADGTLNAMIKQWFGEDAPVYE